MAVSVHDSIHILALIMTSGQRVFCGGDKDIWCVELSDGGDDCWQMVAIRLVCEEWFLFEWLHLFQGLIPCRFLNDSVDLVVVQ